MPRHSLAFYEPSPGPSGPSRYLEAILSELDPDEFELTLFGHADGPYRDRTGTRFVATSPSLKSETALSTTNDGNVAVNHHPSKGWPKSLRFVAGTSRECRNLARVFQRYPISLLHTQNTGCEESPIAARLAGVKRILGTFHVDSTYDLAGERRDFLHRSLEVLSNHSLHHSIAVSRATGEDWVRRTKISRSRVTTIHNGVDGKAFRRRNSVAQARQSLGLPIDGRIYVGGVGRLDLAKGFATLIEAMSMVRTEFPMISLIFAGEGPLRTQLEAQVLASGLADRVHFLGFQNDVRIVYEALDIFCMPSLCEAIGYALLESMSMELPTVGSSVGGIPEVIDHGRTGFLVPPGKPEALANSLRALLSSVELRNRMGEAGRRRVLELFNQSDSVRRTIEVYREMLRGGA